jgi:hypothetical protein
VVIKIQLPFIELVVVELDYEFVEILHEVTESSRPLLASEQWSGARIPALQNQQERGVTSIDSHFAYSGRIQSKFPTRVQSL